MLRKSPLLQHITTRDRFVQFLSTQISPIAHSEARRLRDYAIGTRNTARFNERHNAPKMAAIWHRSADALEAELSALLTRNLLPAPIPDFPPPPRPFRLPPTLSREGV